MSALLATAVPPCHSRVDESVEILGSLIYKHIHAPSTWSIERGCQRENRPTNVYGLSRTAASHKKKLRWETDRSMHLPGATDLQDVAARCNAQTPGGIPFWLSEEECDVLQQRCEQ